MKKILFIIAVFFCFTAKSQIWLGNTDRQKIDSLSYTLDTLRIKIENDELKRLYLPLIGTPDWSDILNIPVNLDLDSTDDVTLTGDQTNITGNKVFDELRVANDGVGSFTNALELNIPGGLNQSAFPHTNIVEDENDAGSAKLNFLIDVSGSTYRVLEATASDLTYNGTSLLGGGGDLWSDPVDSNIVPDGTTRVLGSPSNYFNTLYLDELTMKTTDPRIDMRDTNNINNEGFRIGPWANDQDMLIEFLDDVNGVTATYTVNASGTPSAATDLIDKAFADANYGGGGSSPPFDDTTPLAQDPVDNTKQGGFDVGNVPTGTTARLSLTGNNSFATNFNIDANGSGQAQLSLFANDGITQKGDFYWYSSLAEVGILNRTSNERIWLEDTGGLFTDADFTANSFIKSGATSDDVLLGDGTTTSLATLATLTGSQTLTNKTIDADNNTISNIGSAEITDGSINETDMDVSTNASLDLADGSLQRSGGTMTGAIDMGGNSINNATIVSASSAFALSGFSGSNVAGRFSLQYRGDIANTLRLSSIDLDDMHDVDLRWPDLSADRDVIFPDEDLDLNQVIKSDITAVSGSSAISNMVQKAYSRSEAAPPAGTTLLQTGVPIVETLTGASLDFAEVPFYLDNQTADNNITFTGMAAWMEGVIDIDQASEPTFTAAGYTVSAWDGTLAFASNTPMRYIFQVQPDGSTIKFYRLTL